MVVIKTKVLHFKIENTPMKDKWKEKVQTSSQIPFCGQTRAFRHKIVFPGIQPYLPSEIYSLLFSPTLQHYHISERFQRATKRGKFSRAAWEFEVVLNSRQ